MKTGMLVEQVGLADAVINEELRTISNVRIIRAGMSLNRRFYSKEVLAQAASLFEGTKAYADHGDMWSPSRSVREITGWYTNVVMGEDAIYATRHYTENQSGQDSWALAKQIIGGNAPRTLYGLSIAAVGKVKTMKGFDETGDADVVESISSVISVDDVTTPAAGGAILAASALDSIPGQLLKHITLEELESMRPDLVAKLKKSWQTIRQDEALVSAKEATKKAEAEANALKTDLEEANARLATLSVDATRYALELEVHEALRNVHLPIAFDEDLRKRMRTTPAEEWPELIKTEQRKVNASKTSGPTPPREITITRQAPVISTPTYAEVATPEQHKAYVEQLQKRSN